jgi:hypothetical protein
MKRIYFFVALNTLILPITATSVENFTKQMTAKDGKGIFDLPSMISNGLMGQQTLYIKFILSNTLIANAVTLLDGGHRVGVFIGRFLHKR